MNMQQIIDTDARVYMNTFGARTPVAFVRGEGTTLYDIDGKAYHDFFAGIAVCALGYNHPALTKALIDQVRSGVLHTSNIFYIEPQTRLAELLVDNTPFDRVFISNSGTEAVEGALKLARKYYYDRGDDRPQVISARGSFHGRTLAALAATGQAKYQAPYKPLMPSSVINIPFNDLEALRSTATHQTCAVLLECIQGEGGIIPAQKEYLQGVRKLCDELGILLIIDEIQTGMCRTGKLLCFEHYGVTPDIVTIAKGLGGGVPIGAFMAKQFVADAFHPGDHGGTFVGNHLSCAASLAVVTTMLEENLCAKAAETGAYLLGKLEALAKTKSTVKEVRGMGLLIGVELDENTPAASAQRALLGEGFVTGTAGNNTLRLIPPLTVQRGPIDALLTALDKTLA